MNTSLGALRARLLNLRAWDSTGPTLDARLREAMNIALDRIAGEVPEAVVPDQQSVILFNDTKGDDYGVVLRSVPTIAGSLAKPDDYVMEFVTTAGAYLPNPGWRPVISGQWDGIMHLEVWYGTSAKALVRRQIRSVWSIIDAGLPGTPTRYFVAFDRKWEQLTTPFLSPTTAGLSFRIHQPEFFLDDDVMKLLEPARIFDETRQQVWGIDTGGAYRQDLVDFRGYDSGRPYRFWRGRHFNIPAPTFTPTTAPVTTWNAAATVPQGKFRLCYTLAWGRRETEMQTTPGGNDEPQWESAPSPISTAFDHSVPANTGKAIRINLENIESLSNFGDSTTFRFGRSGYYIRVYVARDSVIPFGAGAAQLNYIPADGRFYFLLESPLVLNGSAYVSPVWDGLVVPDLSRPLRHSTGYYAYSVYPHQDDQYVLDLRIQRLPRELLNDTDTIPIQRDAVPAFIELALYYIALHDGGDQGGASLHLSRYNELARHFRKRYANPGGVVEPTPLTGYRPTALYGRFRNE